MAVYHTSCQVNSLGCCKPLGNPRWSAIVIQSLDAPRNSKNDLLFSENIDFPFNSFEFSH